MLPWNSPTYSMRFKRTTFSGNKAFLDSLSPLDSILCRTHKLLREVSERNAHMKHFYMFDRTSYRTMFTETTISLDSQYSPLQNSPLGSPLRDTDIAFDEIGIQVAPHMPDDLTDRNTLSWTVRISRLVANGREKAAIKMFKSMLLHGQRPNHVTLLTVIRAMGVINTLVLSEGIHALLVKTGFESELPVVTALLGLYSSHGIASVFKLFNQIPMKDLILWTALITACLKNEEFAISIDVFREMQYFGIEPNNVSVLSILNACADVGALLAGKELHGYSLRKYVLSDTNLQNSLVDMYAKCGKLDTSILVFDRILNKDLISWNTIICGCVENGYPSNALTMLSAMRSWYIEPNDTTIRAALRACSQIKQLKIGLVLHCHILKIGLSGFVSVGTALLTMYADFGEVATSRILFNQLHHKDVVAWSAMVSVYAKGGHTDHAVDMFKQMGLENEKANEITLVSLLQACSSMGAQRYGKSIHAHVVRVGFSCNMFIASSLIDFYCKVGRINQGRALFDKIQSKDVVCWNSMINGYGMNGCGEEAIQTFYNMLAHGYQPNDVVFVSILSACSHCGLMDEGWKWFSSMENAYGISPNLVHYSCMVDLLSRCGQVEEALEFINKMPVEPDASVWGALLAGCKEVQGAVEVAELAARNLLRLNPENTSYYVILSNMYAECGRWADVERLREVVREKKLRKTVGYSMFEGS